MTKTDTMKHEECFARAGHYNAAFPDRPPLAYGNDWVTGTWCIGACYKNPNPLYGAYPRGYLERVHSMFPDARRILHAFSGGMTKTHAAEVATKYTGVSYDLSFCQPGEGVMHLVDSKGCDEGRYPTIQCSVESIPLDTKYFDLILADPPYSSEDSEKYGVKHPNISKVMRELRRVARPGANLVWLDQKWPMHRKTDWKTWGHIGLVRSTNHRMRLVSMFEAV